MKNGGCFSLIARGGLLFCGKKPSAFVLCGINNIFFLFLCGFMARHLFKNMLK